MDVLEAGGEIGVLSFVNTGGLSIKGSITSDKHKVILKSTKNIRVGINRN